MLDFQNFLKNINLVDFLIQKYGFILDPEKSSRNSFKVLQRGDETLLVKKQESGVYEGQWFYINAYTKEAGNIIKFVCANEKLNISQKKDLNKLNQILSEKLINTESVNYKKERELMDYSQYWKLVNLTDKKYLLNRGISDKTLNAFHFKGKVFNKKSKAENGSFFLEVAFPYFENLQYFGTTIKDNQKGEVVENCSGIEIKGLKNRSALGTKKSTSLWFSNCLFSEKNSTKIYTDVYVAESVMDVLSFYQLFSKKLNFSKALFLSTGGQLTDKQIDLIHKVSAGKNLFFINDNDENGKYYNCQIICKVLKTFGLDIKLVREDKINLSLSAKGDWIQNSKFKQFLTDDSEQALKLIFDLNNLKVLESELLEMLKSTNSINQYQIFEPKNKDFNEDLTS